MSGYYTLTQNDHGQFFFTLHAANGETILRSELYQSKDAAERGIASVQQNSPLEERYAREEASDGDGGMASVMQHGATTAGVP